MALISIPGPALDVLDSAADAPVSPPQITLVFNRATGQMGIVDGASVLFRDLFVRKATTETVNTSAALQNDDELVLSVAASSKYILDAYIIYDTGTTPDFKCAWVGPSGATLDWTVNGLAVASTAVSGSVILANSVIADAGAQSIGGAGAGTQVVAHIAGLLTVSTTAGTLQFRWAQATSDVSDTKVILGSYLRLIKVA
jgi:hypothetical protein